MTEAIPTEKQIAAWEAYKAARRRAEATMDINDGIASVKAYKAFYNLFVGDDEQLPPDPPPRPTVTTFPLHKTRAPGSGANGKSERGHGD
jgi:hypothetical protein